MTARSRPWTWARLWPRPSTSAILMIPITLCRWSIISRGPIISIRSIIPIAAPWTLSWTRAVTSTAARTAAWMFARTSIRIFANIATFTTAGRCAFVFSTSTMPMVAIFVIILWTAVTSQSMVFGCFGGLGGLGSFRRFRRLGRCGWVGVVATIWAVFLRWLDKSVFCAHIWDIIWYCWSGLNVICHFWVTKTTLSFLEFTS